MVLILGIESSCDETAAAVVADGRFVLSSVIASQHDLHARYGGVVPEIASRAHLERINPVLREALRIAGVGWRELGAVAVGNRPGLIGSLLVGLSAAKAAAWALGLPLLGVDHVLAHLHAGALVDGPPRDDAPAPPAFPALGLVVSGGHTSLYLVRGPLDMARLGRTIDDAVGEAYDKAAAILGLGFPGGPRVDALARSFSGEPFELPRTLLDRDSLDFSFSGLKTALLYAVRGKPTGRGAASRFERSERDLTPEQRSAFAAGFQRAAVDTLMVKLRRAASNLGERGVAVRSVVIGGGVSANSLLRSRSIELGRELGVAVQLPAMRYCLDNAAMIAGLADERHALGERDGWDLPAIATTGA